MTNKRYIGVDEYRGLVAEIARQVAVDNWKPDLIIGITRGGAWPAVMLSHYFNCKMVGLDISLRDKFDTDPRYCTGPEHNGWADEDAMNGRNILIVDDINDSGATINFIREDWMAYKWDKQDNVRFAVLISNEASKAVVDPKYVGEYINKHADPVWIVFPYEEWWR